MGFIILTRWSKMKEYDVTITATITKTVRVEVEDHEDEDKATETAHQVFCVQNDGSPEKYEQDTISCEEVKNG